MIFTYLHKKNIGSPYFPASHWGEALLVARTANVQSHNIRCTSSGRLLQPFATIYLCHWSKKVTGFCLMLQETFFFKCYLLEPSSQFVDAPTRLLIRFQVLWFCSSKKTTSPHNPTLPRNPGFEIWIDHETLEPKTGSWYQGATLTLTLAAIR